MALNYPGFVVPQASSTSLLDVIGQWDKGYAQGQDRKYQDQAPGLVADSIRPLQEYGLDPEQIKALIANPNTREMGLAQIREATQRQADANDPMKQLQLKKAQYDVANLGYQAPTAEQRNFQLSQNDPKFAEFIGASGAQNAPSDVKEYLWYRKNEADAGRQPMEYLDFKAQTRAPGTNVTVNAGENSGAFQKKGDELAATRFDQMVSEGANAQAFTGDLQALTDIAKGLTTGKEAELKAMVGPYAEALGIDVSGLGAAQAYDAIIARMAPQMRQPGSGASSDFDARQFLKSLPALGNSPDGNQLIIQTFQNIQGNKMKAAEIASRAMNGEITWQAADKEIRALGNPFQAFKVSQAKTRATGGLDYGASAAPAEWPGPADEWQYLTPEERALWK